MLKFSHEKALLFTWICLSRSDIMYLFTLTLVYFYVKIRYTHLTICIHLKQDLNIHINIYAHVSISACEYIKSNEYNIYFPHARIALVPSNQANIWLSTSQSLSQSRLKNIDIHVQGSWCVNPNLDLGMRTLISYSVVDPCMRNSINIYSGLDVLACGSWYVHFLPSEYVYSNLVFDICKSWCTSSNLT